METDKFLLALHEYSNRELYEWTEAQALLHIRNKYGEDMLHSVCQHLGLEIQGNTRHEPISEVHSQPKEELEDSLPEPMPDDVMPGIEEPVRSDYQALLSYLEHGIELIPCFYYLDKDKNLQFCQAKTSKGFAYHHPETKKWATEHQIEISDIGDIVKIKTQPELDFWLQNGAERFLFIPSKAGLLCLDIDEGHSEHSGIAEFNKWLDNTGFRKISYFQDIAHGSFPFYVKSSSGGLHLYFKSDLNFRKTKLLVKDVEIKSDKDSLTAGGSKKNGKSYALHGRWEDIPELPLAFASYLEKIFKEYVATESTSGDRTYSNEEIIEFARKDQKFSNVNGSTNGFLFLLACKLKNNGRSAQETKEILESTKEHQKRKDKRNTAQLVDWLYGEKNKKK